VAVAANTQKILEAIERLQAGPALGGLIENPESNRGKRRADDQSTS
jgi:hypothetical protein